MKRNITEGVADVLRPVTSNAAALMCILCEPELDHWNVANPVFCMKPKAINLVVVLRLAEHILALPVTGLITTTSLLQYSNIMNILHAVCNMPDCRTVTALVLIIIIIALHEKCM